MFVFIASEPGLWTVGHYDPEGEWIAESDHGSSEEAAQRAAYLNGGPTTAYQKEPSVVDVLCDIRTALEAICKHLETVAIYMPR